MFSDMVGKSLELLHSILPAATRVAVGSANMHLSVNRRGVPTPIEQAKLLIHLAMEGSLLDAY
jgi:hypothetical protein